MRGTDEYSYTPKLLSPESTRMILLIFFIDLFYVQTLQTCQNLHQQLCTLFNKYVHLLSLVLNI